MSAPFMPPDLRVWNILKNRFGINLFGDRAEINKPIKLHGHLVTKEMVDRLVALLSADEATPPARKERQK